MSIAFPGYIPDVHAADALDPAWGNAIRDRAPQVFTTQATLTAAVVAPQVGQSAVITTGTGSFTGQAAPGEYIYAGATAGWRPPWNNGWGAVAPSAQATTNQGSITAVTDLTGLAVTWTAVANRRYRLYGHVSPQSTVGTDTITLTIADAANTVLAIRQIIPFGINNTQYPIDFVIDTTTPAVAGSYTVKLRLTRTTGTGVVTNAASSTNVSFITVEDIGPNGAPS